MSAALQLWAIETPTDDGTWEIVDNGELLEIFASVDQAMDAFDTYVHDNPHDEYRLVSFTRDHETPPTSGEVKHD